jgi:hypothetical protein
MIHKNNIIISYTVNNVLSKNHSNKLDIVIKVKVTIRCNDMEHLLIILAVIGNNEKHIIANNTNTTTVCILLNLDANNTAVNTDAFNKNIVHMNKEPSSFLSKQPNKIPVNNKYAPEYAASIGHKQKAQTSARIRLGGVY